MRIYLIGYMGCGKSTLGRRLADQLELTFIDLDKYLEERNYKTVPQLFAEYGEEVFRKMERKALEEVSEFTDVVVATGGGAPCFFDNMEVMNQSGITVFIDTDVAVLAERLLKSKTERPLIQGKKKDELIDFIEKMLQKRISYYKKAKITVPGTEDVLNEALREIVKETDKKLQKKS